jgi:L1 cell adhesion molecule like protein
MKVLASRVIKENIEEFYDVKLAKQIPHDYTAESSKKSDIVPVGVIKKDETKTSDMIDIMDEYQKYQKATGEPIKIPLWCDGLSCERAKSAKTA